MLHILQGSVATRSTFNGGNFMAESDDAKDVENRSAFGKLTGSSMTVAAL